MNFLDDYKIPELKGCFVVPDRNCDDKFTNSVTIMNGDKQEKGTIDYSRKTQEFSYSGYPCILKDKIHSRNYTDNEMRLFKDLQAFVKSFNT